MKVGRRLAIKLLNVTKFVLGIAGAEPANSAISDPVDRAMVSRLDGVVAEATVAFEGFDYARALERIETFFWWFCDDYVELVKGRAYGNRGEDAAASAQAALRHTLGTLQRLFAPTLPFTAEEAWSWWHDRSIHAEPWPAPVNLGAAVDQAHLDLDVVSEILGRVRGAKTEAKLSQRAPVSRLVVHTPPTRSVEPAREDLVDALTVTELEVLELPDGDDVAVEITIG
jgi:valyl-tRNA synthetase